MSRASSIPIISAVYSDTEHDSDKVKECDVAFGSNEDDSDLWFWMSFLICFWGPGFGCGSWCDFNAVDCFVRQFFLPFSVLRTKKSASACPAVRILCHTVRAVSPASRAFSEPAWVTRIFKGLNYIRRSRLSCVKRNSRATWPIKVIRRTISWGYSLGGWSGAPPLYLPTDWLDYICNTIGLQINGLGKDDTIDSGSYTEMKDW